MCFSFTQLHRSLNALFSRKPQSKGQHLTTGTFFSPWPETFLSVLGGHPEKDKNLTF